MRIKLDDKYYLNSDKFCYWITCEYEIEKGKNAGQVYERRVSGYTATLEQAVDSYINSHVRSLEAEKITKLAEEIKKLKKTVKSWKVVLTNETTECSGKGEVPFNKISENKKQ